MDSMLRMRGAVIVVSTALCLFVPAPGVAGQATFLSGDAANAALSTYRGLAAKRAIPPLGTNASSLSITVRENTDEFSIVFGLPGDRSASSELRSAVSAVRSSTSRASFSPWEAGTKTFGPAQTSALLSALDFAEQHPAATDDVRRNAAAGTYDAEVFEPGNQYIYVFMSYPGSPDLGKTAIGCNPHRQFRYDTVTNAIVELRPTCP